MNLEALLAERHSKERTIELSKIIAADSAGFKKLMNVVLNGSFIGQQRAAWVFSYVLENNLELLDGIYPEVIAKLKETGHHQAVDRNLLRILQFANVPEKHQGELFDICMSHLSNATAPIATRAFSMTVAYNIVVKHPELGRELFLVIDELLPHASSGLANRGKKIKRLLT